MHVAVLTGGGDCAGLDTVLRTLTLSLLERHIRVTGIERGYWGLMRQQWRALRRIDVQFLPDVGGSVLGCHNRANPFADPEHGGQDVSRQVLESARAHRIDGIVAVGGDGTASIAARLHAQGLPHLVVPKTIDNDLAGTQRCVGFDTAVTVACEALERLRTTARSHRRVLILQTMGRQTGWLALHAGVAAQADVILLPEFPFSIERLAQHCLQRVRAPGLGHALICAAEGVNTDAVQQALAQRLPCEVRHVRLGHVQRGGPPSACDRLLATQLAHAAALDAASGRFGHLVAWQAQGCQRVTLTGADSLTQSVPAEHPLVKAALDLGVSLGQ